MRILIDECVPWPLNLILSNHVCASVQERGWGGIKNGELLDLAETEFDLFITSDQNIRYQQNLKGRGIAILELSTNDIRRIHAVHTLVDEAVERIQPGEFKQLNIPG